MFHGWEEPDEHAKTQFLKRVSHNFEDPFLEHVRVFADMYNNGYSIM